MNEKTGHLAWCALIALLTAREDGLVASESQENLFISRWFAQAKKQRRFPRDVATDIDWILEQGRRLGVRARLRHKLDYLWRSCTGELSEQNDLFRLTYALELAKQYDWVYHVLSDSEWSGRRQAQPPASVNSICLLKSALEIGFNDDGTQVARRGTNPFATLPMFRLDLKMRMMLDNLRKGFAMLQQYTNKLTPDVLERLCQPKFTDELLAELDPQTCQSLVAEMESVLQRPVLHIFRGATAGSLTRHGGVIREVSGRSTLGGHYAARASISASTITTSSASALCRTTRKAATIKTVCPSIRSSWDR